MQVRKEYCLLCLYDDKGVSFLAHAGFPYLNRYKLIKEATGAAIFEKSMAQKMINNDKKLFDVPLNEDNFSRTIEETLFNLEQW